MSVEDDWHYYPTRTRAGALQRGLGRGAFRARYDPAAPDLVNACIRRDHRWFWSVDDRGVYLARLVRDLDLPTGPLVARLFTTDDDDHEFGHVLEVLEALGRSGSDGIVESLRRYVQVGPHWLDVLHTIAATWPANWWDDLLPVAADRLAGAGPHDLRDVRLSALPWTDWTARAGRAGLTGNAADRDLTGRAGLTGGDDTDLEGVGGATEIGDPDDSPRTLLGAGHDDAERPGPDAVPAARRWAAEPGTDLYWRGLTVLADHGDGSDTPVLLAGLDWLDRRPDDLCGYDRLVTGLVRIDGDAARRTLPRIRRLWFSPHSYERAAYLRARLALEPAECEGALTEALWDCEPEVRLLGVHHAKLDGRLRTRLEYLRDDPIETVEVRAAAAERLGLEALAVRDGA